MRSNGRKAGGWGFAAALMVGLALSFGAALAQTPWPAAPSSPPAAAPAPAKPGQPAGNSPAAASPGAVLEDGSASEQTAPEESAADAGDAGEWADDDWDAGDWADDDWAEIERWAEETATPEGAERAAEAAPGNEYSSLELLRQGDDGQQRRIRVVRKGTDDASGIFTICQPQEGEDPNGPSLAVFSESGAGGVEISIDKNLIRVPLALVTQRQRPDGTAGDGQIEAGGGTARLLDEAPAGATDRLSRCAVAAESRDVPGAVQVTQGQTQLTGQRLKYDESDGVARIDGPITFRRDVPDSESGDLSGTSGSIEVDVDRERTVLVGNVVLNSSGGRVSRAARVEYDDAANLARLIGTPEQPAVTTRGQERLQAAEILYDLDRDEAVAWASAGVRISGEFSDGP
ncbi:hypothetical protein Deipr_1979 [Deinococcus proteolyticus MRP]|uniref:Organic solvent tolerance-like N-terminal domain-containing protein n=1 Tax=Deinococcus proteolyticus (strain ATCC 35074 / DSM 20540 / JCM 6276 / NBRC 101906 / NCIMB 13154 / VKM Ac-1939 / CCM 2703 / MRP) TaxID=693977 RepID=F0RMP2_DEIPM|nr:LptA/OstA family protein [Deinococcus proteolyticus]ADY27110.1 hypothetical protein Deipr_1979 [Deinococcus proteolyticus MRP]